MIDRIVVGSGGCFPKDTLISLPSGYCYIQDIEIGTIVCSPNPTTLEVEYKKVIDINSHETIDLHPGAKLLKIIYEYGSLIVTENHYILVDKDTFIEAQDLKTSNSLIVNSKRYSIVSIEELELPKTVYNFEVEDNHTYIANNVFVHNGGGGKKKSRTPIEYADTLRSKQFARVLDLISEGEIGGLVQGARSVFYDNVPLENKDGSYNFQNVLVELREGTQNQNIISDLSSVENVQLVSTQLVHTNSNLVVTGTFSTTTGNSILVNSTAHGFSLNELLYISGQLPASIYEVVSTTTDTYTLSVPYGTYSGGTVYSKTATSVTRRVSNTLADEVYLTMEIPALTTQDKKNGDLYGSSVQFRCDIKSNSDSYFKNVPLGIVSGTVGTFNNSIILQAYSSSSTSGVGSVIGMRMGGPIYDSPYSMSGMGSAKTSATPEIKGYSTYTTSSVTSSTTLNIGWKSSTSPTFHSDIVGIYYRIVGSSTWNLYSTLTFGGAGIRNSTTFLGSLAGVWNTTPFYSAQNIVLNYSEDIYEFKAEIIGTPKGYGTGIVSASSVYKIPIATISGKTTTKYQRGYNIALSGTGPWDIKLTRITPDSTSVSVNNELWWSTYTEIIKAKLNYPNSAIIYTAIDAEQFDNIPARAFEIYGIKCKIPSNYNPYTRIYTGFWDGTFVYDWTDNPAWISYDIISNNRYGLGNIIDESMIDKWTLYSIAQYSDELVPNGFGGMEPRFTCNVYLQSKEDAYRVVSNLASIFRGMIFWSSSLITATQDSPGLVTAIYNPSNIIDGEFSYTGTSNKTRHNAISVSWNNPEKAYELDYEYIEDSDSIALNGYLPTTISAIGCTSRGQANRLGKWVLYTEQYETETVIFKVGLTGLLSQPGDIINTQDPFRAGIKRGGRVVSSYSDSLYTYITLDSEVSFNHTNTYTILVTLPDNTIQTSLILNNNPVFAASLPILLNNSPYGTSIITNVSVVKIDKLTTLPLNGATWLLNENNIHLESWRVISTAEESKGIVTVSALKYNASKYAYVEQEEDLIIYKTTSFSIIPEAVSIVKYTESLFEISAKVLATKLTLSWEYPISAGGTTFLISYKNVTLNSNYISVNTSENIIDLVNLQPGEYIVDIQAKNSFNVLSNIHTETINILGKTSAPEKVTNFSLSTINGTATLYWDRTISLDVEIGGYMLIKHSSAVSPSWEDSVNISPQIPGTATNTTLPLLYGWYLAKWVDSSGNESLESTNIFTTAPNIINTNVIIGASQGPTWSGAKTNIVYSPTYLGIIIDDTTINGVYEFTNTIDIGAVANSQLTAQIGVLGIDPNDTLDVRVGNIDTWGNIDGVTIPGIDAHIEISTSDDAASNPLAVWSDWSYFYIGQYYSRSFKFRLVMSTINPAYNIACTDLYITVDVPDVIYNAYNIVSSSSVVTSITYPSSFLTVIPSVGITAMNMVSGDYYTITNSSLTGFDIQFFNSSNAAVIRNFNYIAKGY